MRVINSIEKEIMQAEWENWLRGETSRCKRMGEMITEKANQGKAMGEDARDRFEDYCQSCREAEKRVFSDTPGTAL